MCPSQTQAKEILLASLPVHEEVQRLHVDTITSLVQRNKAKRAVERATIRDTHRYRSDLHPSHTKVGVMIAIQV